MHRARVVGVIVTMVVAAGGCGGGELTGAGPADPGEGGTRTGVDDDRACRDGADCDDAVFCNGAEWCDDGLCRVGTSISCSDGIACTLDECVESADRCEHTTNDASCEQGRCDPARGCAETERCATNDDCDDGVFCNGVERCSAAAACQPGQALSCDDGVDCTVDVCSEQGRGCVHTCDDRPEADLVPDEWTCDAAYHDADDGCDCGCGVYDPDCDLPDVTVYGCDDGEVCGLDGTCAWDGDGDEEPDEEKPDGGDVPAAWCCSDSFYDANDGCDCDCGAHDPDCEDPDATLYGCPDGQTCSWAGACEDAGDWW